MCGFFIGNKILIFLSANQNWWDFSLSNIVSGRFLAILYTLSTFCTFAQNGLWQTFVLFSFVFDCAILA
jgi:hypothetical protein